MKILQAFRSHLTVLYYRMFIRRVSLGENVRCRRRFLINLSTTTGKIEIGKNTFFNNDCSINAREFIYIGADCQFGENVKIYDHNHAISNNGTILKDKFVTSPVSIGKGCWIGSNVVVLPGVTIGEGCIVGAGSIVTKDIPDHSVFISAHREVLKSITESSLIQK